MDGQSLTEEGLDHAQKSPRDAAYGKVKWLHCFQPLAYDCNPGGLHTFYQCMQQIFGLAGKGEIDDKDFHTSNRQNGNNPGEHRSRDKNFRSSSRS